MPELRLGRLPNDPSKPRLKLSAALKAGAVAPSQADWFSRVTGWPMYLNDSIGDCTCAAAGHMVQQWTEYASTQFQMSDADVLAAYKAVSGYDPATGAHDDGAVMQDVLGYWRKTGIGGHQILAFAEVDIHDLNECRLATAQFGALYLGINFPASAMDQFNAGKPWDVVKRSQIEGGHAINAGWYDADKGMWEVITWGRVQPMTQAFFDKYVEEAWVVVTRDWVNAAGHAPTGIDSAALGKQFAELTGEPSPFPDDPAPVPPDPAPPAPVPAPDPPDGIAAEILATLKTLVALVEQWLKK